jgi:dipeptidyl aminopeptidase/acylaminoacyl peptidase
MRRPILTFFLIAAAACGDPTRSSDPAGPGDPDAEAVDLALLFAPPTADEIALVAADWETRGVSAQDVNVVTSVAVGSDATVSIVSHDVGGVTHYGAVRVPTGGAAGSLPVVVVLHQGDAGADVDALFGLLALGLGSTANEYVLVIPSFRSEPLSFQGETYHSNGEPSPWDRDVDDALALLNVVLTTTPSADSSRIGVVGFSRGACVALLMAVRDPRISVVVEFFGPTDFFGTFVQGIVDEALDGTLRDLPGVDHLNTRFIQPLAQGNLTIDEVRLELVRRSPVYYADRLPDVQVHHGTADGIVPVGEAERLIDVMEGLGRGVPAFESYIYQGGGHNPLLLPGSIERTVAFIGRLQESVGTRLVVSQQP